MKIIENMKNQSKYSVTKENASLILFLILH